MIMTTIPYDEGWQVYVNGEKTETYRTLDALMTFDIDDAGEHDIELKYMPKIYKVGIILSVTGASVFIIICCADAVLKRTAFKNKRKSDINIPWVLEDFDADNEQYLVLPYEDKKSKICLKERIAGIFAKKTNNDNEKDNGEE